MVHTDFLFYVFMLSYIYRYIHTIYSMIIPKLALLMYEIKAPEDTPDGTLNPFCARALP